MKRILSVFLIISCIFGLFGCIFNRENPFPYRGEQKELYTVAIYSIPDAVGYMHHGEGAYSSDIYVWEQDEYGRTLFSYCEDYGNKIFTLLIAQPHDGENVYFYPNENYVRTVMDSEYLYEGASEDHLKNRTADLYSEYKNELKEKNDWNKPVDRSKCVSYKITDHKTYGKDVFSLSKGTCQEILDEYTATLNLLNPEEGSYRYNSVLQVSADGMVLHEIHGVHRNYDKAEYKKGDTFTWYDITLWVITDKYGNYDRQNGVLVMFSKENQTDERFSYTADEIAEFKVKNGWREEYCDN